VIHLALRCANARRKPMRVCYLPAALPGDSYGYFPQAGLEKTFHDSVCL
jgi:hypothetical protein